MRISMSVLVLMLSLALSTGCGDPEQAASPTPSATTSTGNYGAPLSVLAALEIDTVLDQADELAGKELIVEGRVEEVCQNKGCWMTLTDGERHMRVTFQDYGFFVPKDLSGRTVRAEGIFDIREVPVDEARHYLEDAGRGEEAERITEPQMGYVFVASGVDVLPE